MTASELIRQLKDLSPDTKIVIRGYENGYNDISQLKPIQIMPGLNSAWYDGEYDDSNEPQALSAINLFGENVNTENNER